MRRFSAILVLLAVLLAFASPAFVLPRTDLGSQDAVDAALHLLIAAALFIFAISADFVAAAVPERANAGLAPPSLRQFFVLIC